MSVARPGQSQGNLHSFVLEVEFDLLAVELGGHTQVAVGID